MSEFQETLNRETILSGLSTRCIGRNILYFESIDSTNRLAKELAATGAAEGTLVIADSQTAGRGRLRRQWLAPPHSSLLFSLVFRPDLSPLQAARITMLCSLAIVEAGESLTSLHLQLKWPNDIVIGGRKVSGILTELGLAQGKLDFIVVGIGINVNVEFNEEYPTYPLDAAADTSRASLSSLGHNSTSLGLEANQPVSRLQLLQKLLVAVERRYEDLQAGIIPNEEWKLRLETLNQAVVVTDESGRVEGRAEDVDADGALMLRLPNGTLKRVLAGDVTLRASV